MNAAQRRLPFILGMIDLLVMAFVFYLVFLFPQIRSIWAMEGRPLSWVEMAIVWLSVFCQEYGFLLIPLLLAEMVWCISWAMIIRRQA